MSCGLMLGCVADSHGSDLGSVQPEADFSTRCQVGECSVQSCSRFSSLNRVDNTHGMELRWWGAMIPGYTDTYSEHQQDCAEGYLNETHIVQTEQFCCNRRCEDSI